MYLLTLKTIPFHAQIINLVLAKHRSSQKLITEKCTYRIDNSDHHHNFRYSHNYSSYHSTSLVSSYFIVTQCKKKKEFGRELNYDVPYGYELPPLPPPHIVLQRNL